MVALWMQAASNNLVSYAIARLFQGGGGNNTNTSFWKGPLTSYIIPDTVPFGGVEAPRRDGS